MRAFEAESTIVPSQGGAVTSDLFVRMRGLVQAIVARDGVYWTDQFRNTDAVEGYGGIGRAEVAQAGGKLDVFRGGVGTAGMLVGVSGALKVAGSAARIVALESASSAFLSTGSRGTASGRRDRHRDGAAAADPGHLR